jgi:tetrahydromethanopterin S-methyltransferase subunit B
MDEWWTTWAHGFIMGFGAAAVCALILFCVAATVCGWR